MKDLDLHDLRTDFRRHPPLSLDDLQTDPLQQFKIWLQEALAAGLEEPNAMVLATVDAAGRPSQRTVLLKQLDKDGWVFFSHYGSHKAQDMQANPRVSLLFPWYALQRQVMVWGRVEALPAAESDAYFASRPRDSQLGAWASPQSQPLPSREALLRDWEALQQRFPTTVPRPEHWGGFRVRSEEMEFWQGQANRLHDRFRYRRQGEIWQRQRLAP